MSETAEKLKRELRRASEKVLTATPDERARIKRRLVWLANIEKDKKTKRIYRNAYRGIKI